jgi:hypothetical protein
LVGTGRAGRDLKQVLTGTMFTPLFGAARRPREVQVADGELHRALSKALKGSGVRVRRVEAVDLTAAQKRVERASRPPGVGIQLDLARWAGALAALGETQAVVQLQFLDGPAAGGTLYSQASVVHLAVADKRMFLSLFAADGEGPLDDEARRLGLPIDRFVPQLTSFDTGDPTPQEQRWMLHGLEALVSAQALPSGEHEVATPDGIVRVQLMRAG